MARNGFDVRVEGLREINEALAKLPRATSRNVMRRVALARLRPMAEAARAKAPERDENGGDLKASIGVGTRLTKRQGKLNRRNKAEVEAHMGPGGSSASNPPPHGVYQEFGTVDHAPQPFMRPAWDSGKMQLLDGIKEDLWAEINKAVERLARKARREAGG